MLRSSVVVSWFGPCFAASEPGWLVTIDGTMMIIMIIIVVCCTHDVFR